MIIFSIKRGEDDPSTKVLEEKLRLNESGCQYWHLTNDQVCDDEATKECYFDMDDCCDYQNDFTLCQDCFCYDYRLFFKNLMSFIIAIVVTHKGNTDECL